MRRFLVLLLVCAAAVVAAPSMASGGIDEEPDLFVELVSPVEPLTFRATFTIDESCVVGDFEFEFLVDDSEITPLSATQSTVDPDVFTFVLPSNTDPGFIDLTIECDNGDGTDEETGQSAFAAIPVTKVVSGPAPASATFVVHLDCQSDALEEPELPVIEELPEDFTVDLAYGAAGGLKYAYTDHGGVCTITEPTTGGATSVTITPDEVDTTPSPSTYPVTVTNTFAAAIQPTFTG
jgi:Domain of unknown function (DUF5979)